MEVYILDELLRRTAVIDQFESLIWTERYAELGDFELVISSNTGTRTMLVNGVRLALNESYRVMVIENVENKVDEEGRALLTVSGRSLESILEQRAATDGMRGLPDANLNWILTGTPANIARQIFKSICVDGALSLSDRIPFIKSGTIMPLDTLAESTQVVMMEIDLGSVYDAIKSICELNSLGFRLVRNFDKGELYFNIYAGSDHTTLQTKLPPVVFSPELENLKNVNEYTSEADYKNVAYVFSKNGAEMVYATEDDKLKTGFERRVLVVKADDIDEAIVGAELSALLQQRGADELAKLRRTTAFDGEITQYSGYKYGVHYQLGDLVEIRNADGYANNMRVIEQIFSSDAQGDKSYPTLAVDLFITSGSWLSWDANQPWQDAPGVWEDASP